MLDLIIPSPFPQRGIVGWTAHSGACCCTSRLGLWVCRESSCRAGSGLHRTGIFVCSGREGSEPLFCTLESH